MKKKEFQSGLQSRLIKGAILKLRVDICIAGTWILSLEGPSWEGGNILK